MASSSFDNINAPQFFDFNNGDKEEDEDVGYFEQEHEITTDPLNLSDYHDQVTMLADEIGTKKQLRRSMSIGDLQSVRTHIANSSKITEEKINRLAQPKIHKSDQALDKYVPMAEALRKFQNGTPKRFRSRPNSTHDISKLTIPQSPKLQTGIRSRPIYALSHEEQEQLAFEEARKSKFKAQPLDKNIFKSPVIQKAKVKEATVPEPFKITEHFKKVTQSTAEKVPEFHARPVPKSVYVPHQKPISKAQITVTNTPSFMKRSIVPSMDSSRAQKKSEPLIQPKLMPTKPLPFSFELRDKCMKTKREALLQKVMEAEKKAREFHAKPPPKSILEPRKMHCVHGSPRNLNANGRTKSDDNMNNTTIQFKAKPPTVLYKKPFEPKKENKPLLEIDDFVLNTDLRARERENFEHLMKEREEKLAQLKLEETIRQKRQEAEEIMKARKMAEFKAHEIKKYKEVIIQPSLKITNPVSPKFSRPRHRQDSGNKENA